MTRHKWTPASLLIVLFAMQPAGSSAQAPTVSNPAQPTIGVAASVRPTAEGVLGTNSQTLAPGSQVRSNETIRTGSVGRADLVFIDNTNLTVGNTSEVRLDHFVYDPVGSSGKVVLNATRGAFRFATGSQHHKAYSIITPYGSLGVRGTVVELKVLQPMVVKGDPEECVATVRLVSGEAATFRTPDGVLHEITEPGTCGCVTRGGQWRVLDYCPALFAEAAPPLIPTTPPGPGGCQPQQSPTAPCL